jgi:proliferating cell nuclear antigen PCNA
MRAILKNALHFRNCVAAIARLVTNVNVHCTADGISVASMDASKTAYVHWQLRAAAFAEYAPPLAPTKYGLSLAMLSRWLKSVNAKTTLTMQVVAGHEDTMTFTLEGATMGVEFELRLIDVDEEELEVPGGRQGYTTRLETSSMDVTRLCAQMKDESDVVHIDASPQRFVFTTESHAIKGQRTWRATEDDETAISTVGADSVVGDFGTALLHTITQSADLAKRVGVAVAPAMPLLVYYTFVASAAADGDDTAENFGSLDFYLAPKIVDEDNTPLI